MLLAFYNREGARESVSLAPLIPQYAEKQLMQFANTTIVLVAALVTISTTPSFAEPMITYVGLGRYSCRGTAAECAPYEQINQVESERRERAYQRLQEKADAYVERNRREEERRQYEQRR